MTVQTFLEKRLEDGGWGVALDTPSSELDPEKFNRTTMYRISSYTILLRRGEIILSKQIPEKDDDKNGFYFSEKIFEKPSSMVDAYNKQGMGKNRLAGLDIRSCGNFLEAVPMPPL